MEWQISMIDIRDAGKSADQESGRIFEMDKVEIKDRQTLERIYVKAQLCKDPARLAGGELLWVEGYEGEFYPQPMGIRILGKLPSPYDNYF